MQELVADFVSEQVEHLSTLKMQGRQIASMHMSGHLTLDDKSSLVHAKSLCQVSMPYLPSLKGRKREAL